jgi:methylphosphotriester-DNA--protein-cysteine methyltransferase
MTATTTISYEAGQYEAALSRAHLDVIRTGAGHGPNALMDVSLDGAEMFSGFIQFPVMGRTTIADDTIAVATIVAAPPGTRWCEIDVNAGDVLLYGPGTEHTGLSPEGVEYRFALIDTSRIDDVAEKLATPIRRPAPGSVTRLNPSPAVRALSSELVSIGHPLCPSGNIPSSGVGLFRSTAMALTDPSPANRPESTRGLNGRAVINKCVDYADSLGRCPSIAEMCVAAYVSERRLRNAFHDAFDMPPSRYFRARMLSAAREGLQTGRQDVSRVALETGFRHLGRFAQQYADLYDERPRDTLAAAQTPRRPQAHDTNVTHVTFA